MSGMSIFLNQVSTLQHTDKFWCRVINCEPPNIYASPLNLELLVEMLCCLFSWSQKLTLCLFCFVLLSAVPLPWVRVMLSFGCSLWVPPPRGQHIRVYLHSVLSPVPDPQLAHFTNWASSTRWQLPALPSYKSVSSIGTVFVDKDSNIIAGFNAANDWCEWLTCPQRSTHILQSEAFAGCLEGSERLVCEASSSRIWR